MVCVDPTFTKVYLLWIKSTGPSSIDHSFSLDLTGRLKTKGFCWIRRLLPSVWGAEHVRRVHVEIVQRSS